MSRRLAVLAVLAAFALLTLLPTPAQGQSASAVLAQTREDLRNTDYSVFLVALADLGSDAEVSSGNFRVDEGATILRYSTTAVPIVQEFDLGRGRPRVRVEATLGYVESEFKLDFNPGNPAFSGRAEAKNLAISGDVGAGPSFEFPLGILVEPLFHLGGAYIDNDTRFKGPAGPAIALLTDGVLFNTDGWFGGLGASIALRWNQVRLGLVRFDLMARYDFRRTFALDVDKDADDSPVSSHWLTTRLTATGPLFSVDRWVVEWTAHVGYRRYLKDLRRALGFTYFALGGGGLRFRPPALGKFLRLTGTGFWGNDVRGWTVDVGVDF